MVCDSCDRRLDGSSGQSMAALHQLAVTHRPISTHTQSTLTASSGHSFDAAKLAWLRRRERFMFKHFRLWHQIAGFGIAAILACNSSQAESLSTPVSLQAPPGTLVLVAPELSADGRSLAFTTYSEGPGSSAFGIALGTFPRWRLHLLL